MSTGKLPSDDPKVSVVIPVYNMAEFVGAAIESVLNGEYENVEVICVNDGSTDETARVVRRYTDPQSDRYDDRVRYFTQSNQGKPVAVNNGIDKMNGEYFALLDADDCLPPESLQVRVNALNADPSAEVAIGGFDVIDEDGTQVDKGRSCPTTTDADYLMRSFYLKYKTPFHLNTCLVRRDLLERVGGFDPYLDRCEDGDYAIRCMSTTQGVTCVDKTVYLYRKHRETVRSRILVRLVTARYRPAVIRKNYSGARKYLYMVYVVLMDTAKMVYEVFANYKK